jgi:hypothetical protein
MAPGGFTVFEPERFKPRMAVHGIRRIDFPKRPLFSKFSRGNRVLLPVTGFRHHEGQTCVFDRIQELVTFVERHRRWHGTNDVFALIHGGNRVLNVIWSLCEDGDRIKIVGLLKHLLHRVINPVTFVRPLECHSSFWSQIGDSSHGTLGMFMPLERGAKSATDNPDLDFLRCWFLGMQSATQKQPGGAGRNLKKRPP